MSRLASIVLISGGLVDLFAGYEVAHRDESEGRELDRLSVGHIRLVLPPAERPNERWSMDFVTDRLESGRPFRVLTVVDQFSRECPLLEPACR